MQQQIKYEGVTVGKPITKTVLKKGKRECFVIGAVEGSNGYLRVAIPYSEQELANARPQKQKCAHIQIVRQKNVMDIKIGG